MASVMNGEDGKNVMADEERDQQSSRRDEPKFSAPRGPDRDEAGGGFFTVYKSGQGYWTRLITFLGFLLLGALTAHFVYSIIYGAGWTGRDATGRNIAAGIGVAVFLVWVLVEYWILNKPSNAEFLIATDSEMKKVNWTSRKELIGSTKVVIFFMFMFAATLFIIDIVFGFVFHWMSVLKTNPFGG